MNMLRSFAALVAVFLAGLAFGFAAMMAVAAALLVLGPVAIGAVFLRVARAVAPVLLLAALVACGSGTVTSPNPVVTPSQPAVQAVSQPTPPAPAPADSTPDMEFHFDAGGTLRVVNRRAYDVGGHVCVYEYGKTGITNQQLVGDYPATWLRGESVTPFPSGRFISSCGLYVFQLDALAVHLACPADPYTLGGTGFFKGRAGIEVFNDACQPPPPPCKDSTIGTVTVKADTHITGTFLYEVRDGSRVVWSKRMARSEVATFEYAPDGKTLRLYVETKPGKWESGEKVTAKCGELKRSWNEDISYDCNEVCR